MRQILKTWRVPIATFLSLVFIVGAYLLARGIQSPQAAEASAETALLAAIATRDTDGDGLPDWEEALYGTSPSVVDTFKLGMTDGEAVAKGLIVPKAVADISVATSSPGGSTRIDPALPVPPAEGTLTAAFSRNFLTTYLAAKGAKGGADLSQDDVNAIANQVLSSLSSLTPAPDFKTAKDLTVSGSGTDALKAFAASAEAVLVKNTANATTSEINYLKSALQNNDMTALPHITSLAKAYRGSAIGLAVLPVPKELATDDLLLVNTLMREGEIASDFARVNTDPLAAMLALYQYPQVVAHLTAVFIDIWKVYLQAGISLPAGAPGASFANLVPNTVESHSKKP